jgi:uncharacterized repeat protein (TIGR01451 family)/fimbrial isopeptide formation D2 family protein
MKKIISNWALALLLFVFQFHSMDLLAQQTINQSTVDSNGFTLKKSVVPMVASGEIFHFHIDFTLPTGTGDATIQDVLPPQLDLTGVSGVAVSSGPTPTATISGQSVSLTLTRSATANITGSFDIFAKFKNGITCNGASVGNRACFVKTEGLPLSGLCTDSVTVAAVSYDPWAIRKYIISTSYGQSGTACNKYAFDRKVKYRIVVNKVSPASTGYMDLFNAMVTDDIGAGATYVVGSAMGVNQNTFAVAATPTLSGNVLKWNLGTLISTTANENAYTLEYEVTYPASATNALNTAKLEGTLGKAAPSACATVNKTSNQTCIEFKREGVSGLVTKLVSSDIMVGCDFRYTIIVNNNGTVPITNYTLNDVIPSTLIVASSPSSSGLNAPQAVITTTTNNNVIVRTFTANFSNATSPLPVGQSHTFTFMCNLPNATNVTFPIKNCVTLTSNQFPTAESCASFDTISIPAKPDFRKEVVYCGRPRAYTCGDTITYRIRLANMGGMPIVDPKITDNLPLGMTFVPNSVVYYQTNGNGVCNSNINGIFACSLSTNIQPPFPYTLTPNPNDNSQILTWQLPTLDRACGAPYANFFCSSAFSSEKVYFIEFKSVVTDVTALNLNLNTATLSGGNISNITSGAIVDVSCPASYALSKTSSLANVPAGGTSKFTLELKNQGNQFKGPALYQVTFVDLLANDNGINDNLILNRVAIRSPSPNFNLEYIGNDAYIPTAKEAYDASTVNARVNTLRSPSPNSIFMFSSGAGSNAPTWVPSGTSPFDGTGSIPNGSRNIAYNFGTTAIPFGNTARATFDVKVPLTTPINQEACNTFAANAATRNGYIIAPWPSQVYSFVTLTNSESGKVCIKATSTTQKDTCCPRAKIRVAPQSECCSKVQFSVDSNCLTAVRSITVSNVVGGAITSMVSSMPCTGTGSPTTINFTSPCILTANQTFTMCGTGNPTTGMVIYDIVMTLANGRICSFRDTILCKTPTELPQCCPNVSFKSDSACRRIVTLTRPADTCISPISKIEVIPTNGLTTISGFFPQSGGCTPTSSTTTSLSYTPACQTYPMNFTVSGATTNTSGWGYYNLIITLQNGTICKSLDSFRCGFSCPTPTVKRELCKAIIDIPSIGYPIINVGYAPNPAISGFTATGCNYTGTNPLTMQSGCNGPLTLNVMGNSSGTVYFNYYITYQVGSVVRVCEYRDSFVCCPPVQMTSCCPKMQVIKRVTPCEDVRYNFSFAVTGTPICRVVMSGFTTAFAQPYGGFIVDGGSPNFNWTNTNIATTGNINATTSLEFTVSGSSTSTGTASITVVLCDSTRCTYTYSSTNVPTIANVGTTSVPVTQALFASSFKLNPSTTGSDSVRVQYMTLAPDSCDAGNADKDLFFAISGGYFVGDASTTMIPFATSMQGKTSAYFQFKAPQPIRTLDNKLSFNIVTTRRVPRMKMSFYDTKGGLISSSTLSNFQQSFNTGVAELRSQLNISVSPNPVRDRIKVNYTTGQAQKLTVDLVDILGQRIAVLDSGNKLENVSYEVDYDVSQLSEGIYFVRLTNEAGQVSTTKVTVVR